MGDFSEKREIKHTLKAHRCEQCGHSIPAGSAALYFTGRYDGEFYAMHVHPECHEAASEYASIHCLAYDEWPWFRHDETEHEDRQWMREKHPIVADRLGWRPTQEQPNDP